MPIVILGPLLFIISAAYAAVGLAGGTAYLSVISFYNADPQVLRPTAWALNIVVATVGFNNFRAKGHFQARSSWPFLVSGIIGAALGAWIPIGLKMFQGLLAISLVAVAVWMFLSSQKKQDAKLHQPALLLSLLVGLLIGFISGLVGIGGGIMLGPVVIAIGWFTVKQSAPLTALYILLTSASALATHLIKGGPMDWKTLSTLSIIVLVGGFLGSRYGAGRANPATLKRLFSLIVLAAGLKLSYGFLIG